MKLENNLNIDIVDDKPPEPVLADAKEQSKKDNLLSDVPLDNSDSEADGHDGLDMGFVAKPKPDISDIFDDKQSAVSQAVEPVEPIEPEPVPVVKVVKEVIPTKPTKKKRKPMSEEHRAKLAISREKALARRKYLAEQRKIEKAQQQLLKDQEQLLKQKEMEKKLKDLQSKADSLQEPSISEKEPPLAEAKAQPKPKSQSLQGFSMDDIQNAQLNAIMSYEAVRKKRKAEKKKKIQEDAAKKDIMNTIKNASPSWYLESSPYNGMF